MWPAECTHDPPKHDLWPSKRRNTEGSITQNNRRVDFIKIHHHTKFERNPSRNAAIRAHTYKNVNQNMTFDPIKDGTLGGSITKNYRCVDLTMMHIFERNPSRNVACRAHTIFPPKYDLWPYKRRNTGGSITKNKRRVDFPKIYTSIQNLKEIRQEMQLLESTQECEYVTRRCNAAESKVPPLYNDNLWNNELWLCIKTTPNKIVHSSAIFTVNF